MNSKKNKILYLCFLIITILLIILPVRAYFQYKGFRWLYILICSFTFSFAFTPVMKFIAVKAGAVDIPNERKAHKNPTPILGGIAVYLAFIGAILTNYIFTSELIPILLGSTVIIGNGIIDDISETSAGIRLGCQLIACFIVIYSGVVLRLFPVNNIFGSVANIIITTLWIVGITNALNFFDGMDGLAAGVACIIAFFLGVIAFQTGQITLGWLSISIVGACIGFLPFNFNFQKPAAIYLGDTGSTFLGFVLSCLAVKGNWSQDSPIVSFTAPLLIFSVLIFDIVYITIFRIKSKRVRNLREWIEYVDRDHLHHRLEALFRSKRWSVIFIYFITICLSLTAVLLKNTTTANAMLLLLQAVLIIFIISILERSGRRQERRKTDYD